MNFLYLPAWRRSVFLFQVPQFYRKEKIIKATRNKVYSNYPCETPPYSCTRCFALKIRIQFISGSVWLFFPFLFLLCVCYLRVVQIVYHAKRGRRVQLKYDEGWWGEEVNGWNERKWRNGWKRMGHKKQSFLHTNHASVRYIDIKIGCTKLSAIWI